MTSSHSKIHVIHSKVHAFILKSIPFILNISHVIHSKATFKQVYVIHFVVHVMNDEVTPGSPLRHMYRQNWKSPPPHSESLRSLQEQMPEDVTSGIVVELQKPWIGPAARDQPARTLLSASSVTPVN